MALSPPAPAPNVLIFRSALLSYSETFIPAQAEALQKFTPHYAGFIAVNNLQLPPDRTLAPSPSHGVGVARDAAAVFGRLDPFFLGQVRAHQPRLIHAHFEEGGIKALPLAEKLNVPLVTTCHGYDVTVEDYRWQRYPLLGPYYQKRRRDLFLQGDLFLGVSRFICDQMIKRGYPRQKVKLHYIGIDPVKFTRSPAIVRKPVVLFVGRLVEKKGCADVIKAMATVSRSFPEVELMIIGDGPLREELKTFAQECRIKARFLGAQPPEFVREAMAEALVFCAPSVRSRSGDAEGLGLVFLEAAAMNTPVVSTRHGGIPEAVEHGVTGLLCAERQPLELADAILTLLRDESLRTQMGVAGRARVVAQFNLETQTRLLEDMYASLLG